MGNYDSCCITSDGRKVSHIAKGPISPVIVINDSYTGTPEMKSNFR